MQIHAGILLLKIDSRSIQAISEQKWAVSHRRQLAECVRRSRRFLLSMVMACRKGISSASLLLMSPFLYYHYRAAEKVGSLGVVSLISFASHHGMHFGGRYRNEAASERSIWERAASRMLVSIFMFTSCRPCNGCITECRRLDKRRIMARYMKRCAPAFI